MSELEDRKITFFKKIHKEHEWAVGQHGSEKGGEAEKDISRNNDWKMSKLD